MLAYDYLGLIYYYLGNIKTGEILHKRMALGKTEPVDSSVRIYKVLQ